MTWNLFWKKAHRTAALALVGLLISPFDRRGLALAVPHVLWRARHRGWKVAPQLAVADVAEVAVLATGSVRYGSVLL